ncbi:MAG: SRPBCC family protein [Planctomycetaceae bacterium]|nr:SRPBCC family protein [Planctomycetaceae bacterium]
MTPQPKLEIGPSPRSDAQYRLEAELWLDCPREEVFPFFADAFNLERITPPWLNFHVVSPAPIEMSEGTLIDYRLRLHGIPFSWRTMISRWEPPFMFVDQQLRGPYRLWHHEHQFLEVDGGTLVRDIVDYSVPGGAIIHWLMVERDVRKIFEFRMQQIIQHFSAASELTQAAGDPEAIHHHA